jgi:hypothetical protein
VDDAETLRGIDVRRTEGEPGVVGNGSCSRKEVGTRLVLCDVFVGVPMGELHSEGMLIDAGIEPGRVMPWIGKACFRGDDTAGASVAGLSMVECRLNVRSSHLESDISIWTPT